MAREVKKGLAARVLIFAVASLNIAQTSSHQYSYT